MSWQDDLMAKAKLRSAANNGQIDSVSELDNADMAAVAPSLGLPAVDPTSIPLQQGLSNQELANEQYNKMAQQEANDQALAESNVSRAPAVMPGQNVSRGPASPKSQTGIESGEPVQESQTSRLERMIAELNANRKRELDEAGSKELRGNLLNALSENIGGLVGGAQAMNTGAAIKSPTTGGMKLQDFSGQVDRKFKPEQEQLMAQYKALKAANQPMTEYQRQMLAGMAEQRDIQRMNAGNAMDRYYGTDERLRDKQKWTQEQKDEYSDKQSESLTGFDKTDALLSDIEKKMSSGKYDKYIGPYASKYENMKTLNPLSDGMDTDFAAFQSDTTDTLSQYIKGLSGLTVSDAERKSLMQSMPKVSDKPQEFNAKLKATQLRLRKMKEIETKALANYQGKSGNAKKTASQGEVSLGKTEASAFPRQVRNAKTGQVATVSNEEELKEANTEGFN